MARIDEVLERGFALLAGRVDGERQFGGAGSGVC